MKTAFMILLAALVLLLIEYIRYRRQVADICRQIRLHRQEKTNIDIRTGMGRAELTRLRDGLNALLADGREERAYYISQETRTKELITDLAHDIRTPLTSLDGYFTLLSQADSPEEREKYRVIIAKRLRVLWELLEQLFTYAKLQNGAYRLECEPFDGGQCVCETVLSFYEDFRARGIEPEIDIPDGEVLMWGDKTAFGRVVQNLLRNALIHGKDRISLVMQPMDTVVRFQIRNNLRDSWNGDIEKIFDRFYTADESRTNRSSGLGLPVAKQLTEAMNGTISAEVIDGDFVMTLEFMRYRKVDF